MTSSSLRELFRNLQIFRAAFEADGIDSITGPDGTVYNLFDIEYLYAQLYRLSPRQKQAIELCLIMNIREKDAAVLMGVSPSNPVAAYATDGLVKLVGWTRDGTFDRYQE